MKIYRRHVILFVLSFIIILTSMCLGKTQIDADFRFASKDLDKNELLSVIEELPETDTCTETMLGIKKNSVILNHIQKERYRNINQKKISKDANLIFLSVLSSNLSMFAYITNMPVCNHEHIVQIYIHKSDGKKRA